MKYSSRICRIPDGVVYVSKELDFVINCNINFGIDRNVMQCMKTGKYPMGSSIVDIDEFIEFLGASNDRCKLFDVDIRSVLLAESTKPKLTSLSSIATILEGLRNDNHSLQA